MENHTVSVFVEFSQKIIGENSVSAAYFGQYEYHSYFYGKNGGFFDRKTMWHNFEKSGLKSGYANQYTAVYTGEWVVDNWEKPWQNKSFPHIPQVFPQAKKNGALFISVDIKTFDKIELFSSFFDMDKMNNRKFWQ